MWSHSIALKLIMVAKVTALCKLNQYGPQVLEYIYSLHNQSCTHLAKHTALKKSLSNSYSVLFSLSL